MKLESKDIIRGGSDVGYQSKVSTMNMKPSIFLGKIFCTKPLLVATFCCLMAILVASIFITYSYDQSVKTQTDACTMLFKQREERMRTEFDQQLNAMQEQMAMQTGLLQNAISQIPARIAIKSDRTGTIDDTVTQGDLYEANAVLAAIETMVNSFEDTGLSEQKVRSVCESIHNIDLDEMSRIGSDYRERTQRLYWVEQVLMHIMSDLADCTSDQRRSRQLFSERCAGFYPFFQEQLNNRIIESQEREDLAIAKKITAMLREAVKEAQDEPVLMTRVQKLERVHNDANQWLTNMVGSSSAALAEVQTASKIIDALLLTARKAFKRSEDMRAMRESCEVISAEVATIKRLPKLSDRLIRLEKLEGVISILTTDYANADEETLAILAKSKNMVSEISTSTRLDRARECLAIFDAIFSDGDWAWYYWEIDEVKIMNALLDNIVPVDRKLLPPELQAQFQDRLTRGLEKLGEQEQHTVLQSYRAKHGNQN